MLPHLSGVCLGYPPPGKQALRPIAVVAVVVFLPFSMPSPFSIRPGSDAEDFHEPNLIRIKADPNYLDRLNLIQTPILIPTELNSKVEKC